MKRVVKAGLVAGLIALWVAPMGVDAGPPDRGDRIDVCHWQRGREVWKLKSLRPRAAAAHLAHGDAVVGDLVPGMPGFKFDETCTPVPLRAVYVAGPEADEASVVSIGAALDELTAEAGVPVTYVGAADFPALVDDAIATGERPSIVDPGSGDPVPVDILLVNQPVVIPDLADAGVAVPAAPRTIDTVTAGWPADWVGFGMVDGTSYGVPSGSLPKSLVWYKPSTFRTPAGVPYAVPTTFTELLALTDSMIANGQTPWCIGNETGDATGFVFTDWVEDRVLGSEPPSLYDGWVANDVGFTDARIRSAWTDVVGLWNTPGAVFEGLTTSSPGVGITETSFFESFLNLSLGDECLMHKQATFVAGFVGASELEDLATFRFPADDAADDPLLVAGTFAVALDDDVEVVLTHEFFGTVDYADARQATQNTFGQPSGFLSAVSCQDPSLRTPLEDVFTELLWNADTSRYDASDLMPPDVGFNGTGTGFWGEGTRAAVTPGNTATVGPVTFVGTTVDDATQNVEDIFCLVAPGAACS